MTALLASADWGHRRYMDDGWHPLMGLIGLLLLGAAIGVIVGLWRRTRQPVASASPVHASATAVPLATVPPTAVPPTFSAEVILAERLARGEISPDDYRILLAALREQPPTT
jgi:uncharacterized membrane protein